MTNHLSRREFCVAGASALAGMAALPVRPPAVRRNLELTRLSWAGVKLRLGERTLLIDPWVSPAIWGDAWTGAVAPLEPGTGPCDVLITHLHNDHYDRAAITQAFDGRVGRVVCHTSAAAGVASDGFRVRPVELWRPELRGDFTVIAVPAEDGFNEYQVSWVVLAGGKKIIHCGDTLWHGAWWEIARAYGPFDVAFVPINGAVVSRTPASNRPAVMTPADAAAAAAVLGARLTVPIHYGVNDPGSYEEYPDALATFEREAARQGVAIQVAVPGSSVNAA